MDSTEERRPRVGRAGIDRARPTNLSSGRLAEILARLAMELQAADCPEETAEDILQFALQALDCSMAGIALSAPGQVLEIPALTDPAVAEIYHLQFEGQAGPLVVSLRERTAVLVEETNAEVRWPEWAAAVANLGMRSVLNVPLVIGDVSSPTTGVLSLYHPKPDAFDTDDQAIAQLLAGQASIALALATNKTGVDACTVVGQATGILMERLDLDSDRAFAVLLRCSQQSNRKLLDVAKALTRPESA